MQLIYVRAIHFHISDSVITSVVHTPISPHGQEHLVAPKDHMSSPLAYSKNSSQVMRHCDFFFLIIILKTYDSISYEQICYFWSVNQTGT